MLALPAECNTESFEGVTLVRMPDSADDLERMLKALYLGWCVTYYVCSLTALLDTLSRSSKLPYPRLHPDTPLAVKRLLSIAKKYQISTIRDIIMERLQSDWPQILDAWDSLQAEIAHYQMAQMIIEEDRSRRNANLFWDLERSRTARWDVLASVDFLCLLRGQRKLRSIIKEFHYRFQCNNQRCRVNSRVEQLCAEICRGHSQTDAHDVLKFVNALSSQLRGQALTDAALCDHCQTVVYDKMQNIRVEIWSDLPEWFELGDMGDAWCVLSVKLHRPSQCSVNLPCRSHT